MSTVNEKMTTLANKIRTLSGTTESMGLDSMATKVNDANTEVSNQMDLIEQIVNALDGKASGGGNEGSGESSGNDAEVLKSLIEGTVEVIENDKVTSVGSYVFYESNLTNISLPNCTSIDYGAFCNCYNLTTVNLPNCTTIDDEAFYYCSSLINASFPECTSIGSYAFAYCTNLTSASFTNCTTINFAAFMCCTSLESIQLSDNISYIGDGAFSICTSLNSITYLGKEYIRDEELGFQELLEALENNGVSLGEDIFNNQF